MYVARVRSDTLLVNVRERERERGRPHLPRESPVLSRVPWRSASVAINSDCTRELHSDLAISNPESRVRRITLSPQRCGRADHKSRCSGETSEFYDGSRYRDGTGTVIRPMVLIKTWDVKPNIEFAPRSIDLDGFSPPHSCLIRPKVVSDVLANPRSRALRFKKPDAISFPVCKWRNRARGDEARLCRARCIKRSVRNFHPINVEYLQDLGIEDIRKIVNRRREKEGARKRERERKEKRKDTFWVYRVEYISFLSPLRRAIIHTNFAVRSR